MTDINLLTQTEPWKTAGRSGRQWALYTVVIALLPVIQIYKVPGLSFGVSTLFIGLLAPYSIYKLIQLKKPQKSMWLFGLFMIYILFRSIGSPKDLFLMALVTLHVFAAAKGAVNWRLFRKTIEIVSMLATACVILQTIFHYIAGANVNFVAYDLLLKNLQYYRNVSMAALYRPSAFFLEPSHLAQYMMFALITALYWKDEKTNGYFTAIVISLGIVLSTSGMGIISIAGIWFWYISYGDEKKNTYKRIQNVIIGICLGLMLLFLLMRFSFFSTALMRITGRVNGYNALAGRLFNWSSYITPMSGRNLLFGYGAGALPEDYLTGFMSYLYCFGTIGLALMAFYLLKTFTKSKWPAGCSAIVFLLLLFVTNMTSFINLTFYFCLLSIDTKRYFDLKNTAVKESAQKRLNQSEISSLSKGMFRGFS